MWRTMLRPRWWGSFVALLAVLAACTLLGLWQLGVAKDTAQRDAINAAATAPVVGIDELLTPHGDFPGDASGRRVSATGRYDASGQVVVPDRRLDGVTGSWVITPLVVDSTGARIAVLRAFVQGSDAPAPTTTADVTVVGSVAPGESPATTPTPLPSGQLGSVDLAQLVNLWPGEIYNAFLFAVSETPDASGALTRVPPPPVPSGLTLRNAAYAVQWWVFGLFAAWMWWRMVRDDHLGRTVGAAPDGGESPTPTANLSAPAVVPEKAAVPASGAPRP